MGTRVWEVVGGSQQRGIQVRGGCSLTSAVFECRLSKGALVLQRALRGSRLRYSLLAGGGPTEGWVSTSSQGKALLAPAEAEESDGHAVVACVGDSITSGGCVGASEAYPAILRRLLRDRPLPEGFRGWSVRNYGVGQTSATRESPHTPYVRTQTFRDAVKARADVYVVCFGTNDANRERWSEEGYVRGLCRLVEAFQAVGPSSVLLLTPPPVCMRSGIAGLRDPSVINGEIPRRILPSLARELGVPLLDAFGALGGERPAGSSLMLWDGVHPSAAGNEVIARLVLDALVDDASYERLRGNRAARALEQISVCQRERDADAEAEGEECQEPVRRGSDLLDASEGLRGGDEQNACLQVPIAQCA